MIFATATLRRAKDMMFTRLVESNCRLDYEGIALFKSMAFIRSSDIQQIFF